MLQLHPGRLSLVALFLVVTPLCDLAGSEGELPRAAVFSERLPGFDQVLAREIGAQVQGAGYATEDIGTTILTNQALLTTKRYDLLVLPGARSLPMAAALPQTHAHARSQDRSRSPLKCATNGTANPVRPAGPTGDRRGPHDTRPQPAGGGNSTHPVS